MFLDELSKDFILADVGERVIELTLCEEGIHQGKLVDFILSSLENVSWVEVEVVSQHL